MNMTFADQATAMYGPTIPGNSTANQQGDGQTTTNAMNSTTMVDIINQYHQRRNDATKVTKSPASLEGTTKATQFNHHENTTIVNETKGLTRSIFNLK